MVSTLLAKLTRLDADIRRREQHAVAYTEWLRATPGIVQLPTILPRSAETTAVYHVYLIEVEQRDDLVGYLPEHHVETETYYPAPLQLRPCFADLGYVRGDFPRAEAACERAVALPLYPDLTTDEIDRVCKVIHRFYTATDPRFAAAVKRGGASCPRPAREFTR